MMARTSYIPCQNSSLNGDACKAPEELVGDGRMHVLAKKWRIDISFKSVFFSEWFVLVHFLITDFNYRTKNEIHYFMVI